jgi:hypothetical protein
MDLDPVTDPLSDGLYEDDFFPSNATLRSLGDELKVS